MSLISPGFYRQGVPGIVTLSGETTTFNDTSAPWFARCDVGIDVSSGNMYEYGGTSNTPTFPSSYTQIDSSTDWLRGGSDDGNFQVRVDETSGTLDGFTINGVSKSVGFWYDMDGDVILSQTENVELSSNNVTVTISIRYGGIVQDTGSYTLSPSCNL